jgi:hypothetical protein
LVEYFNQIERNYMATTDEDVRVAQEKAEESQTNADEVRQAAKDEHYEAAEAEKKKGEELE